MSEQTSAADTANAAMRRYWNEVAGPRWVERAEIQESRNIEVAHLVLREAHPAARRAPVHGGVGVDRRQPALEDPVRDRGAACRAAGAAAAKCARAARLPRPGLPAPDPERGGLCRHYDRAATVSRDRQVGRE